MRRGYDPLATWRYAQRVAYDEERQLDREGRTFSRCLAALAMLALVVVLAGCL